MNVLMVVPSYFPIIGGSETVVETLTTKLNEMGINADILTFNMNSKWNTKWKEEVIETSLFKIYREPAISLSKLYVNPLKLFKVHVIPKPSFLKLIKKYDVLHFHGEADLSFPIFSTLIKKPKVFHSHANKAIINNTRKEILIYNAVKLIYSHLANVYVGLERPLSEFKVKKSKMRKLSIGIDTDVFKPDDTKRINNLILFVGRIDTSKGLHILTDSLYNINTKIKLVIIGPKWNTAYADQCLKLLNKMSNDGLHEVKYLGSKPVNEIIPWYQKAAILVRPDLMGLSGGMTSLEALSCGTPVIGTGNHLIKHNINGLIVPPNNSEKLSEALNILLFDKDLREKLGKNGRENIVKNFSFRACVKELISIYRELLNNKS